MGRGGRKREGRGGQGPARPLPPQWQPRRGGPEVVAPNRLQPHRWSSSLLTVGVPSFNITESLKLAGISMRFGERKQCYYRSHRDHCAVGSSL